MITKIERARLVRIRDHLATHGGDPKILSALDQTLSTPGDRLIVNQRLLNALVPQLKRSGFEFPQSRAVRLSGWAITVLGIAWVALELMGANPFIVAAIFIAMLLVAFATIRFSR